MAQATEKTHSYFCTAEYFGNYLYVAARFVIYRYHTVNNSWKELPHFLGYNHDHEINCLCVVDDYIYAISEFNPPHRCNLADNNWQRGADLSFYNTIDNKKEKLSTVAAVALKSKIYVIHGYRRKETEGTRTCWVDKPALVHCFDPAKNEWEQKASTCHPHFGSSLFVVNNRLYVAGPSKTFFHSYNPLPVEVYNEKNNTWSVVEQKHIPPNNLGAVEIEERVYFIINKFPIDSGISIPPGENYPVSLNEWENLAKVSNKAVLSYLPVKTENLKTGKGESQTD